MRKNLLPVAGALCLLASGAFTASAQDKEPAKPWKVKAELSYVRSQGNSDAETFAGGLKYEGDYSPQRFFAKAGYLFTETEGDTTANRGTLEARYEYILTQRLFGFVEANYLRDRFAGYDNRVDVGPGLGYDFIRTDAHQLKGLASVLYTYEDFTDGGSDRYASGKLKGDYSWQITETSSFNQVLDYLVSFEDTDVYFINSVTSLEMKLHTNIALALSYRINYQNEPPEDADHTDRVFLASLVLSY